MQIFNDRNTKVGILSGYKDRAITTTLASGDKELSFLYPASGPLASELKEECYIRTKTDEFVLKAIEKGEEYNKYTAVLNVEDLEGTVYPYGFESQEQTISACLGFAFMGTGWSIGQCTVTKRRTINEEESVSAWEIFQKCLDTYRCECNIHTLTKTIDLYESIGSDRGCYFIEGLNLRNISMTSDTYDFYTRIYPIGKDGITPEWVIGHEYIDNTQYSSKIKAYVWKDERYTNTTSLIEDATAKLDEMSRPYTAYTADVVDLAQASNEYNDILTFGIGDTVTLVSKKMKTREKQRIVKITEYPESPIKNTVEISNAKKTFAEIQKEETAAATEEAISVSRRATLKALEDYSTTEDIESKIAASKSRIELEVAQTLESYYDKTETDALISVTKGEIELGVSTTYQTKAAMGDYSTTADVESKIATSKSEIELDASRIYQTKVAMSDYSTTAEVESKIAVSKNEIELGVSSTYQTKAAMNSYSTTADVESKIATSKSEIELGASQTYQTKAAMINYSTTAEVESKIAISKNEIELGVSSTYQTKAAMTNYSTTADVESKIATSKNEIELDASQTYQTKEDMDDYSTTAEVESKIAVSKNEIELGVSTTYQTKAAMDSYSTTAETRSMIAVTANAINQEVSQKVDEEEIISKINQSAEQIKIAASKINLIGAITVNDLASGSGIAQTTDIPTNVGELINDAGYINSATATTITQNTITTQYVNALNVRAGSVAAENITGTTLSGVNFVSGQRTRIDEDVTGLFMGGSGFDICWDASNNWSDGTVYGHFRATNQTLQIIIGGVVVFSVSSATRYNGSNIGTHVNIPTLLCHNIINDQGEA